MAQKHDSLIVWLNVSVVRTKQKSSSLPSQNKFSKFFVNPEVDEKVSEVVEVDQVESVGWYRQVAVDSEYDACVAEDGQQEEAHSNFDRFLVTCYVCGVT